MIRSEPWRLCVFIHLREKGCNPRKRRKWSEFVRETKIMKPKLEWVGKR